MWTGAKGIHVVYIEFPSVVCKSIRIALTLRYEYHLFVAVSTYLINIIMSLMIMIMF
jgi:hypothetical protein